MAPGLPLDLASRFARVALGHVTREYPNKLDHVLAGPADVRGPRALHPVFYGSFDWHSCVHGYWLLASLYRLFPAMPEASAIRRVADTHLRPELVAGEIAYLMRPGTAGFERPYGWAWLLMLATELGRHRSPEGTAWSAALQPLAAILAARLGAFLPIPTYPVRGGAHANTAFALVLALDYALAHGDDELATVIATRARSWYGADRDCQAWEPSGEDFLSPALIEALCMRRVMPPAEFSGWLDAFLPALSDGRPESLFTPAIVSDRSDGKIAHLDGLNLSRAWCWRGIAGTLPQDDARRSVAIAAADRHSAASLPFIEGDYMGEHWLASFALLALLE